MIVSHQRRFVYIGPPKTGSTTLHHWLSQPAFCDRRWTAKEPQHGSKIPESAAGYFTFASVRNPFSRAVSLWSMSQNPVEATIYPALRQCSFAEFVATLPEAPWFYRTSQADIIGSARLDAVVRFESLESVKGLPPIALAAIQLEPLPHLYQGDHAPWPSYYTPEIGASVRRHFAADFERFSYDERL